AARKAGPKLSTWNPGTMLEARRSMRALMTNRNSPKVMMVRGNVSTFSRTPRVALMSPITRAARKAAPKLSTRNPEMRRATMRRPTALSTPATSQEGTGPYYPTRHRPQNLFWLSTGLGLATLAGREDPCSRIDPAQPWESRESVVRTRKPDQPAAASRGLGCFRPDRGDADQHAGPGGQSPADV